MIDNDPDELYHELRRKLEGYGSAPPESVWAGIREQVPARQPRYQRALLVLLLLCFVTGSVLVGKRYWPLSSSPAPELARTHSLPTGHPTGPTPDAAEARSDNRPARTARRGQPVASPLAETENTSSAALATGPTLAVAEDGTVAPHVLPAPATRTTRNRLSGSTGDAQTEAVAAVRPAHPAGRRRLKGMLTGTAARSRSVRYPGTDYRRTAAKALGLRNHVSRWSFLDVARNQTASGLTEEGSSPKCLPNTSNAPLALLTIRPDRLTVEEPAVQSQRRPARKRPSQQELRLRNWSGQILLGQSVTYRFLGGSTTQLEQLERPGLGFSGQISGAYAFSRQLTVAGGLGYTTYANTLRYQVKKASSETVQQQDFRDVYRFFTIPVQAQLTLGSTARWRYGVLGGGSLALLTGARTTVGSACNCRQRAWTRAMPDSLLSRTNFALTGGAFASYQFTPGQWLTVRPQADVFLNSLTGPSVSRASRRPWALGVQVGYSWDLDPRKH